MAVTNFSLSKKNRILICLFSIDHTTHLNIVSRLTLPTTLFPQNTTSFNKKRVDLFTVAPPFKLTHYQKIT